jgi:pyridoxamine 5'-phosphate oxidase
LITFNNISRETPYLILKEKFDQSLKANQENIEAISISSYSNDTKEVNSRFVNLKFIKEKEFIFFTNYDSCKSKDFNSHNQITALIFWNSINAQIRIKAKIKKTPIEFNKDYFKNRNPKKNALAISSDQSSPINSYEMVQNNYNNSLRLDNLKECPDSWGGFSFTPYYFEFWEGHESRLNKRDVYELNVNEWKHHILQP